LPSLFLKSRFGGLNILTNNAARGMRFISESFLEKPALFWQSDTQAWRMIIDTNVNGPYLMARAAVPHLIANRWGRIINISITQATMRRVGFSPYGPSKAAIESETIIGPRIWPGPASRSTRCSPVESPPAA